MAVTAALDRNGMLQAKAAAMVTIALTVALLITVAVRFALCTSVDFGTIGTVPLLNKSVGADMSFLVTGLGSVFFAVSAVAVGVESTITVETVTKADGAVLLTTVLLAINL